MSPTISVSVNIFFDQGLARTPNGVPLRCETSDKRWDSWMSGAWRTGTITDSESLRGENSG